MVLRVLCMPFSLTGRPVAHRTLLLLAASEVYRVSEQHLQFKNTIIILTFATECCQNDADSAGCGDPFCGRHHEAIQPGLISNRLESHTVKARIILRGRVRSPSEAQRSGFGWKRKTRKMNALSRLRGSERYGPVSNAVAIRELVWRKLPSAPPPGGSFFGEIPNPP